MSGVIPSVLFNDALSEPVPSVIYKLMSRYWCNNADRGKQELGTNLVPLPLSQRQIPDSNPGTEPGILLTDAGT